MLAAEPVIEHIEYRAAAADHDAFVLAFAGARAILRAARGCRHVAVTRCSGELTEYRVRIEWRSAAERDAFEASDAARVLEQKIAAFERRSQRLDTFVDVGGSEVEHESSALRRAFGHYPTGVAVITAMGPHGPAGMVVTSFTSVSLKPALVAFSAAHTSTTWPVIADARTCCINMLAATQGGLCRQLAAKGERRFEGVEWTNTPSGAPLLTGVVGWLDCRIVETRLAGDHDLVLLEVLAHDADPALEPLVFHRSGYRTIAP